MSLRYFLISLALVMAVHSTYGKLMYNHLIDYQGVLSAREYESLEQHLHTYEMETGSSILIRFIDLAETKRVPHRFADVEILMDAGTNRIEILSREQLLTETQAYRIREDILLPSLKSGNYAEGILGTLEFLTTGSKARVAPVRKRSKHSKITIVILGSIFFVFFVVYPIVRFRHVMQSHLGSQIDLATAFFLMSSIRQGHQVSFGEFRTGSGIFAGAKAGGGGSAGSW